MSYIALYRKWRPLVFEEVVEQEHVVKTLKYSVSTGRIGHAYLFCGTRGTGKTTMAHILSRAINCLNPLNGDPCNECEICKGILSGSVLDVLEIDAASNNSVDNVREIREEVIYAPSQTKYKVYIIDEVHMLSTGAFNALLKTLEEPPEHVVFILATTEPHKLPATILSRCQRFDFRRISIESIADRLNKIATANNITLRNDASRLIARLSDGALRDAISLLDQCISIGNLEITYSNVLSMVGIVNDTFMADMVDTIKEKQIDRILGQIDKLILDGKDIIQFVSDLILYYRNLLICKISRNPGEIIDAFKDTIDIMRSQCACMSQDEIIYTIKELSLLESGLKWATHPRVLLEVSLIKLCENDLSITSNDITDRLSALERRVGSMDLSAKAFPKSHQVAEIPVDSGKTDENTAKQRVAMTIPHDVSHNAPKQSVKYLEGWDELINDIKNCKRMVLYSNLLDTKAVQISDGIVGIVLGEGNSFKKMLISKAENIEVIEGMVSKKLGREIRIKCIDEDTIMGNQTRPGTEEKDEFTEKAEGIAKRFDITVNYIDE